jgi:hypothetical protein
LIDRPERVKALISCGRIGFLKNADILASLLASGVQYKRGTGVYWERALSGLMEEAIAEGYDYILTVDWDSYFCVDDVAALVALLDQYPEADAVCAVQMRRGVNAVLMAPLDADAPTTAETFAPDLLPLASGHFGLTLLRASAFADLPKPWFHSQPGPDGRWTEHSTDADVGFWRNWVASGHTLFCACHVVIGHGDEIIVWPSAKFDKPIMQYPAQWDRHGKPKGAL